MFWFVLLLGSLGATDGTSLTKRHGLLYQIPLPLRLPLLPAPPPPPRPFFMNPGLLFKPAMLGTTVHVSNSPHDFHLPPPPHPPPPVVSVIDEATPFANFVRRHMMSTEHVAPLLSMAKFDKQIFVHHFPPATPDKLYEDYKPPPPAPQYGDQLFAASTEDSDLYGRGPAFEPFGAQFLGPPYTLNQTETNPLKYNLVEDFISGPEWDETELKYGPVRPNWFNQTTGWIPTGTSLNTPLMYNLYDDYSNPFQNPLLFEDKKANEVEDERNNSKVIYVVNLDKKGKNVKQIKLDGQGRKASKSTKSVLLFAKNRKKPYHQYLEEKKSKMVRNVKLSNRDMSLVMKKIINSQLDLDMVPSVRNASSTTTTTTTTVTPSNGFPVSKSSTTEPPGIITHSPPSSSPMRLVQVSATLNVNNGFRKTIAGPFYPRPGIVIDEKRPTPSRYSKFANFDTSTTSTATISPTLPVDQLANRRNSQIDSLENKHSLPFTIGNSSQTKWKVINNTGRKSKATLACEQNQQHYIANVDDDCKVRFFLIGV